MSDPAVAEDFLKHYLPKEILPLIDFNTLSICRESYINEELNLSDSDVLFQVNIANQIGFIYILIEHQSSVHNLMPFRILQYMVEIWSSYLKETKKKTLPLIILMVFYHGKTPYNGAIDIKELIEGPVELIDNFLLKLFHLIDTNIINDEVFKTQHLAGFMAFIMKKIYARDFMNSKGIIYDMLTNIINKEGADAVVSIITMLNYLIRYGRTKMPEEFINNVHEMLSISKEAQEEFMDTVAEYLIKKGRKEGHDEGIALGRDMGREEGFELGRKQTCYTILQHLIAVKFGTDFIKYRDKIFSATPELLEKWVKKVISCDKIEELFEE